MTSLSPALIHCDEQLIVIDKPTLLLSVPGRGEAKQDSVVTRLAAEFGWVREAHRLDWETSGLMVLARSRDAHSELSRQFREREVEKRYCAIVFGELEQEEGEVQLPLRGDWPNRPRQMVDREQGKASHTRWRRIAIEGGNSRVELTPLTGRTHQLRVHMQAIGHPILGDRLYAHERALGQAERLLLHASELGFHHPQSGGFLRFESDPPF